MNIEQIRFWLNEEQSRLAEKHRDDLEAIQLNIRSDHVRVWAWGKHGRDRDLYRFGDGATFEQAIEHLMSKFENTAVRIDELRNKARDLLRQANDLEKELTK